MAITVRDAQTSFTVFKESLPAFVPTVAEDIETQDCWVDMISLSHVSTGPCVVTISDKQGTPVKHVNTTMTDGDLINNVYPWGRLFYGGINVSCDTASKVVMHVRWKR